MDWIFGISPTLRKNPEFQSAVVRLVILTFGFSYIGSGGLTGYYKVDTPSYIGLSTAYLLCSLWLLRSVLRRPVWELRQYFATALDITATSLAIFLTREAISPFYLIYIWIFISAGTRYGRAHLIVAAVAVVISYNTVLVLLDEWRRHTFEASFFLLLLVALPLYQYVLLRKLQHARAEAERANRAKRLDLILDISSDVPHQVVGDQLRVRQILLNFLGNAAKFTEKGEVVMQVSVSSAASGIDRRHLLFAVKDTGIGIAADQLKGIFDSFQQADHSATRQYGGSGLGTTIARELATLMGGAVGADSEVGKGSRFWVRLPLEEVGSPASEPAPGPRFPGRSALIFEANPPPERARAGRQLPKQTVSCRCSARCDCPYPRWAGGSD